MRKPFIVMLLVLSLAAIACRLGSTVAQDPAATLVISTEEAEDLEQNLGSAAATLSSTGEFELQVTESQLTSFVVYRLESQPETGITEPRVFLRDERIKLLAKYTESFLPVDIEMVILPQVSNGKLVLTLESAKLGPLNAPEALVDLAQQIITEQVEPAINESLANDLYIETLSIADGVMYLQGTKP